MKAAAILSTLALAVVLCSGHKHGKHHGGKHHGGLDVTIVKEIDPRLEGYGYGEGYTFKQFGGLQYSFLFQEHDGVFAGGSVIEQGDRCGLKGVFSCGKGCGAEDPVCKAVFTKCGTEGAKCRSNEVCVEGACYPYVCEQGFKCFNGARTVCEPVCRTASKTVCHDEKVYVCGKHFGGRRLSGGSGYNSHGSGGDPAWGGSGAVGGAGVVASGAAGSGSIVSITHGSSSGGFFDPSISFGADGFGTGGFGAGCGFVTRQVCEEEPFEVCEEICAVKEGFFCTEETCGSDPEMVACGRGYCRLGDMCYQPSCDHACLYNKKHFCW